jgi:uncharacterized protein (DUF58 family)
MTGSSSRYLRPEVLVRLTGLELRARRVVEGFVSGQHRSPYRGYSVEFAEHREYVPGDDIRHIDWRVYGRADRYYIKQYEEETNLRTHLLVDCSGSMRYPEHPAGGRMTKFEYAATAAASLAFLLTQQQDAVGLLLFDDRPRLHIPPAAGPAHLRGVIAALEAARLEHPTEMKRVMAQLAGQLRRRSLVVILSDLLADAEEVVRALEQLRFSGHDVVVMHVLDHDERTFPFQDHVLFEGLERPDERVFSDPPALRAAYLAVVERFIRRVRGACLDHRMDYVELTTSDPLDLVLRRYLTARAAMR